MTDTNVTSLGAETLREMDPDVRVTSLGAAVVRQMMADVRLTSFSIEVLRQNVQLGGRKTVVIVAGG